ncbi:MAG: cyclic nucleotide-binding domain-containing protein [Spirochaetes bacterium]|nr:cyclic nucleotide-binding domain-containing protein [Spirochaetota bacterium]
MKEIEQFLNSLQDKCEITPDVTELIQENLKKNPVLKDVFLKNLDSILRSNSQFKFSELEMLLRNIKLDHTIQTSIEDNGKFIIAKRPIKKIEQNSLRIETESCGVIQFRVPPNTIKKAHGHAVPVAQYYVLTGKTFYNGMNYIDIAFPIFENYYKHRQRKTILLCVDEQTRKNIEVLCTEEIFGPSLEQLRSYGLNEEEAFAFFNELKLFTSKINENGSQREATLNDFIEIHTFKDNTIQINDVQITRREGFDYFFVKEKNKNLGYIDLIKWEPVLIEEKFSLSEPGKESEFGVYFFDPSTGFDPERLTSSFIIWIGDGKGMVVDPLTNLPQYLDRKRINRRDIDYLLLTHVHSDHDDGVLEEILSGKEIKLLTTRVIMGSFINKVKAITGWNDGQIKKYIHFQELIPNQAYALNKKTSILVDYAFHSIPTCRFVVSYNDPAKKIKKSISYSGDTNYDKEYIKKLVLEKKLTRKRADAILGFIWDSDLIIHDAGGGLHTDAAQLSRFPDEIQKKIIAIHISELPKGSPLQQAKKGEEIILAKADKIEQFKRMSRQLDEVILFKNLTMNQKMEIIEEANREQFGEGDAILEMGETAVKFYIILTGEVEIITESGKKIYLGKGDYFGEMAFFSEQKTRNATAYARTNVELLSLPEEQFNKYKDSILEIFKSVIEIRPLLSNISFFNMLVEKEINALSLLFKQESYLKGDYIIHYGETGEKFYIIKNGIVNIITRDKNGKEKEINQIGTGNTFGEMALIEETERSADVVVESDRAEVIMIDKETFKQIVSEYPGIAVGLEEIKNIYREITKERL